MFKLLTLLIFFNITFCNTVLCDEDIECDELENIITTGAGVPVDYEDTYGLNKNLFINEHYIHDITHFVRERIPQRVVHANGAGGFGYFEVTHDISHICKADMFSEVGKKTPIAMRFSPVFEDKGGFDTTRGAKGFGVKFYTKEGNFDIAGFSTPMFPIKDPLLFTSLVRAFKNNPVTGYRDFNTFWDFVTLNPESINLIMETFGDRGIPRGYPYMSGFPIHTYEVVNSDGVPSFVRLHITPDAGIQNIYSKEATRISGEDPDYYKRNLFTSIEKGEYPSWTLNFQVLSLEDVHNATFDVFDVTKVLPLKKYPLIPVGRLVLNRNPVNYFAEIEQVVFNPASLVPGILGAPDKLFQGRRLAYRDAQYYRLGVNFQNIPVNCPIHGVNNFARDGVPPLRNAGSGPNYYPNSFGGPKPYNEVNRVEILNIVEDYSDNFEQAAELYSEYNNEERERLIQNVILTLKYVSDKIKKRIVRVFTNIHPDLGYRMKLGLEKSNH